MGIHKLCPYLSKTQLSSRHPSPKLSLAPLLTIATSLHPSRPQATTCLSIATTSFCPSQNPTSIYPIQTQAQSSQTQPHSIPTQLQHHTTLASRNPLHPNQTRPHSTLPNRNTTPIATHSTLAKPSPTPPYQSQHHTNRNPLHPSQTQPHSSLPNRSTTQL